MEDYKFLQHLQDFFVVLLHGRSPTWQNLWRPWGIYTSVNIQKKSLPTPQMHTQIKIIKFDITSKAKDWQRDKDTHGVFNKKNLQLSYSIKKFKKSNSNIDISRKKRWKLRQMQAPSGGHWFKYPRVLSSRGPM